MTAITPLESIHKKGIFGNHHKKNESDLLQISEVKHLKIIQVVQCKRSKIQLSAIQIDNLRLPIENSKVASNKETRILWNAPKTWLIISTIFSFLEITNQVLGALQRILVSLFDETFGLCKENSKPSICILLN